MELIIWILIVLFSSVEASKDTWVSGSDSNTNHTNYLNLKNITTHLTTVLESIEAKFSDSNRFDRSGGNLASLEFVQSVHDLSTKLCECMGNVTEIEATVSTNQTMIHVVSHFLSTMENRSLDFIASETNVSGSGNITNENSFLKVNLSKQRLTPCDGTNEDAKFISEINCLVAVNYQLELTLTKTPHLTPTWETFIINDPTKCNESVGESSVVMRIPKSLSPYPNTKCGKLDRINGIWNSTSCETIPRKDYPEIQCVCSGFGIYALISSELGAESPDEKIQYSVSFLINGNYGTEIGARRQKKFGRILLDQIFTLIEYTNSTWDNETIIVTSQPRNERYIQVTLTFPAIEISLGNSSDENEVTEFITMLETEILEGPVAIIGFNGSILEIPVQNLTKTIRKIPLKGKRYDAESVFLWVVFGIVILVVLILIILGIRKQKREYQDSVQPITFRAEGYNGTEDSNGVEPSELRHPISSVDQNGVEDPNAAKSMTTILSESMDLDGGRDEKWMNIGIMSDGVGIHPRHQEIPNSMRGSLRSVFHITEAMIPNSVADDDPDSDTIYSIRTSSVEMDGRRH